jgi:hypothetical protein
MGAHIRGAELMGKLRMIASRVVTLRTRASVLTSEATTPRVSARERGYTNRWDKASAAFRSDNPLCIGCKAVGRIVAAKVTDHIVPHKGDVHLMWDAQDNWQSACAWHHDVVKQRLEAMFAAGEISDIDLKLDSTIAITLTNAMGGVRVKSLQR